MFEKDGVTEYYVLFGFWMIANTCKPLRPFRNDPFYFENVYEIINEEDPDCELFAQYRTIVNVFRDHQVVV